MPAALAQFVHLGNQVAVVLIAKGRNKPISVAMSIGMVATGALLPKDCASQRQVTPIAVLRFMGSGFFVQEGRNVHPILRPSQLDLRQDSMHGTTIVFQAGEIGQLPHQVIEALRG